MQRCLKAREQEDTAQLAPGIWGIRADQPTVASDGAFLGMPIVLRCRKCARSAAANCAAAHCLSHQVALRGEAGLGRFPWAHTHWKCLFPLAVVAQPVLQVSDHNVRHSLTIPSSVWLYMLCGEPLHTDCLASTEQRTYSFFKSSEGVYALRAKRFKGYKLL